MEASSAEAFVASVEALAVADPVVLLLLPLLFLLWLNTGFGRRTGDGTFTL
jgi:hypothetical protein